MSFNFLQKTNEMLACTPIGFNLKQNVKSLIENKFSGTENVRIYAAATILDSRFKKEGFSDPLAFSSGLRYIGIKN